MSYSAKVPGPSQSLQSTDSDNVDRGSASDWDIANGSVFSQSSGSTWTAVNNALEIAVKGTPITGSDDATLSNLQVFDTEPALASLTPAFDPAITEYTAVVANEHTSIELDAALNDQNATVQFLDENDVIIPIDSTVAPNISYILPNIEVGDNVFKVKVTAEDSTTTKTYQVTVTRVDFLVSNLGQTEYARNTVAIQNDAIAAQFTTGDNPAGYTINKITADMLSTSGGTPAVSIYSDNSGEPGSSLVTLTNPGTIPTTQTELDFTATDYRVLPGTTYWVVFELTSSSGSIAVVLTESPSEDAGSAPNWSIGDNGSELASGTWSAFTPTSVIPKLAIKGGHASPTTPNEPTSLTTSPGNTEVTLAWAPPAFDGGAAITKYQYRVSADGGTTWTPDWTDVPDSNSDSDLSDERSVTVTSLANGTLHTFQVRAVNSEGSGSEAEATETPVAGPSAPDAPASLTATAGDAQVTLTWTAPTSDGGQPITKYQYRVSVDDGTTWSPDWTDVPDGPDTGTDLADERTLTLTGLEAVILHTFQVRAVNSIGDGAAAQTTATPTAIITLAADFTSIIRELHEVTFTLTRTGSTALAADVTLMVENATGDSVIICQRPDRDPHLRSERRHRGVRGAHFLDQSRQTHRQLCGYGGSAG